MDAAPNSDLTFVVAPHKRYRHQWQEQQRQEDLELPKKLDRLEAASNTGQVRVVEEPRISSQSIASECDFDTVGVVVTQQSLSVPIAQSQVGPGLELALPELGLLERLEIETLLAKEEIRFGTSR